MMGIEKRRRSGKQITMTTSWAMRLIPTKRRKTSKRIVTMMMTAPIRRQRRLPKRSRCWFAFTDPNALEKIQSISRVSITSIISPSLPYSLNR